MRISSKCVATFAIVAAVVGAAGSSAEAQCRLRLFGQFRMRTCAERYCPPSDCKPITCCEPAAQATGCDSCATPVNRLYGTSPMYPVLFTGYDGVYYHYATSCCDQNDLHVGVATSTYPLPLVSCSPTPGPEPIPVPVFAVPPMYPATSTHYGDLSHEYLGYHDAKAVVAPPDPATTTWLTVAKDDRNRVYKFHIEGIDEQTKWFLLFYAESPLTGRLYFAREFCDERDRVTYAAGGFSELTDPVKPDQNGLRRSKKIDQPTVEGPLYKARLESAQLLISGREKLDAVVQIVVHGDWGSPICP
jgi:hypothetical protein